jgi:putative hemolysin
LNDPLVWQILLQLILILINAFFSCSEIAIISINDTKLRRMAESGQKSALALAKLTKQPARFLATIQVGITLAGFLGSAFAAENFADRLVTAFISGGSQMDPDTLHTLILIVITLILSYFTLVLGELVPKRIAMKKPEPIALAVGRVIYFFSKVATPLVWLLTASTNALLRLFRINPQAEENQVTEEEIRIMVDLGEEKGAIAPEEGEMIDNVLELSEKTAVELMTPRTDLEVLWLEDPPEQWEELIFSTNHSRYPVCGEDMDEIVGFLHVRDYFKNIRSKKPAGLKELLRPAYLVPETVPADILLREMKLNKTHMAVVVDEYGGTSGVITMEDLLEEIVGQIEDEHDNEGPDIVELEEGHWRARGSIDLDSLSEAVGFVLPEGDYETLGGLIYSRLSSIPEDGAHPEVDVAGLHIRVEELTDHRVEWAELIKKTAQQDDEKTE